MEAKNFDYSLRNVPIPSKCKYLKCIVEKIEIFVRRLRWKSYHFCKENSETRAAISKTLSLKH